jgi:hypothetical protein
MSRNIIKSKAGFGDVGIVIINMLITFESKRQVGLLVCTWFTPKKPLEHGEP